MGNYPSFPRYQVSTVSDLQNATISWANELVKEIDLEDAKIRSAPSTNIYAVTTVSTIGRPRSGDVAFSVSSSKFRGYITGTGWVDFN